MAAYYNEFDPFAAAWLRELIKEGLIADGDVDERDIRTVSGRDLEAYTQVHLFAGIGGWSYALRRAGWEDDRSVWTGSCPCQPFSAAGKQQGTDDARHLWPDMLRLLAECRPSASFGAEVASALGREWLAGVRTDLEALGYAVGAADLCAAGVQAPHIRQRLYWLADANGGQPRHRNIQPSGQHGQQPQDGRDGQWVGDSISDGLEGPGQRLASRESFSALWAASVAICAGGKFFRVPCNGAHEVEPALFPVANGIPNRMGLVRGAGNAIVPQLAAEFIRASGLV